MISRRTFLTTAAGAAGALTYPAWGSALSPGAQAGTAGGRAAPATCELALANKSLPGQVRAYVTGHEQGTGRWVLLKPDGGVYRPESPSAPQTPLPVDCAIPLSAAGSAPKVLTLPQMFGARVYFVRDDKLDFFLNPGPALVEPAFATRADPNYGRTWSFCEFTFNPQQLYANISYVDLVTALPIGLTLEGDGRHTVAPLPDGAVDRIAADLTAQAGKDGQPWDKLVIRGDDGGVLRVISPQNLMAPYFDRPGQMPFRDVWNSYIDKVWDKYRGTDLRIDLQGGRGVFTGRVNGDVLTFNGGHSFPKPTSKDIFTCNHGPFANNPNDPDDKKGLLARLAAGFNRSIMLTHPQQPNGTSTADYYRDPVTNHWSRVVHANSPIGYAFPYDDVRPDGQPDVSGAAHDGNPRRFTVSVGS
ncbi:MULTISPECIES: glycoside hydrolase family 64 protein [Streptomyces]|uniref:Sugar hydrolase n=1 Tax=Streptomyces venezuelae TaxID=54571 RepID=A0A5P2BJK8_STRVZ|nr:glycoside hydrolase family 64 protein [Streptomyces venezuelae]MYY85889.1 sugar hydrolase [Streptomyces sp. SID335]MYZ16497.1 sugar hydrolase [Streptomyces sp. SID337]NDZ90412.1 sugar hydrolase [Streptomyces sp. SID10115]NEB48797.1 sugar hydrolase [Streptomyces sp. SID339]QES30582.1 sugar hydrolase [Streptomyces venezuelae]